MTAYLEFEGQDVEKAARAASERLGISIENLKYDIVSYGSTGIFGLVGARKAKIRVSTTDLAVDKTGRAHDGPSGPSEDSVFTTEIPSENHDPSPQMFDEALLVGRVGLQKILNFITEDAAVVATRQGGCLVYEISGGNPAALIGKRGQTLEALQYLVEKMVNSKSEESLRVHIDVEDYLKNRAENLATMASQLAGKVLENHKPATLGQLNSHERRIVHQALKEKEGVRTQSIGSGYYRKLVIYPQKKPSKQDPGHQPI